MDGYLSNKPDNFVDDPEKTLQAKETRSITSYEARFC
jgi:hypothetical protein